MITRNHEAVLFSTGKVALMIKTKINYIEYMKLKKLIVSSASLALLAGSADAANIILNGDFEAGLGAAQDYNAGSEFGRTNYVAGFGGPKPTNWALGPGETRGWSVTTGGTGAATFPAQLGSYMMRLDANNAGNPNGGPETLRQSGLALTAGLTYTLDLDLFGGSATGANVLVQLIGTGANAGNDITVGTFTDSNASGIEEVRGVDFSSSVTSTGEYELRLSTTNTNNNHAFVDNVVIDQTPEPSSTALLGLGGLALILRRKK